MPISTIGYEKRFNSAVKAAENEDRFIGYLLAGQPEPPLYFARMKRLNRDGVPILGALPEAKLLSPEDLRALDLKTVTTSIPAAGTSSVKGISHDRFSIPLRLHGR